jgi:Na+/H+ antiporter NhaD/arsenite permease-like protein
MTLPQILAFTILAGMMGLFVWGRIRYDLVAVLALLAAVLVGIVPADKAFVGFSDDIVIIVASALLVSAAVAKSGILEVALARIAPYVTTTQAQMIVLVTTVTVLSAFVKNIGALAMMIPVAFQMARRTKTSPSRFLMPMAFGSLLGGLVTLVVTSPNIIVAAQAGDDDASRRTGAAPPRSRKPSPSRTTSPRRASLPIPRWWAAPSRICTGSGRIPSRSPA